MSLTAREAVAVAALRYEKQQHPDTWQGFAADAGQLLTVCGNADGSTFWQSQRSMADALGWCLSKVENVLRGLRRLGLMFVRWSKPERAPDGTFTRRKVNRYTLAWKTAYGLLKAKDQVAPTPIHVGVIPRSLPLKSLTRAAGGLCAACGRPPGPCPLADATYCGREGPP